MSTKQALIITTSHYVEGTELAFRSTVAEYGVSFAELLEDLTKGGFDSVVKLPDCGARDVSRAITTFFREASEDDTLLLYVTGHVLFDADEFYLTCADTELEFLNHTTISESYLLKTINGSKAKHQFVMLDAPFVMLDGKVPTVKELETRLQNAFQLREQSDIIERVVMTAMTKPLATPAEDDPSMFTFYLADGLDTNVVTKNDRGVPNFKALFDFAVACIDENDVPQTPQQWVYRQGAEPLTIRDTASIERMQVDSTKNPTVFFSYKREDEDIVQRVYDDMQLRGVQDIWMDRRKLEAGEDWSHEIKEALKKCTHLVLFVSKKAMFSEIIAEEVSTFDKQIQAGAGKFIIPVIVDQSDYVHDESLSSDTTFTEGKSELIQACQTIQAVVKRLQWVNPTGSLRDDYEQSVMLISQKLPKLTYQLSSMVHVPAGEFMMGELRLNQRVHLDDFWIGKWVVTVAEFANFVRAGGLTNKHYIPDVFDTPDYRKHRVMAYWPSEDLPTYALNHPEQPMRGLTWLQAYAYCEWLNHIVDEPKLFRLPTETEWEKSARGTAGNKYPWGNDWQSSVANTRELGRGEPIDCGSLGTNGDSPYGCQDMAGNVWEWTVSLPFENNFDYDTLITNDFPRIIRGGDWKSDRSFAWTYKKASDDMFPVHYQRSIGMRLVATRDPSRLFEAR